MGPKSYHSRLLLPASISPDSVPSITSVVPAAWPFPESQAACVCPVINFQHSTGEATALKFGVLIFPGSNCDHDAYWTIQQVAKQPVTFLWHESHDLENCDAIIVPGGFSYGDYLRTGAIAKFSPVMDAVKKFAAGGGIVLGICNGFQILCESGLLPGALMRNVGLKYVCKPVDVRVESTDTPFTNACRVGEILSIPIGHMEGNYFCDQSTLAGLQREQKSCFATLRRTAGLRPRQTPMARSITSPEFAVRDATCWA